MLVLGLQQIGGGGSDTVKLLTFLNLPNGRSMMANKFKRIEDSIRTAISDVTKKGILASVEEEIQLTFYFEKRFGNYEKWKRKELSPDS